METINEFLTAKGLDTRHVDSEIEMQDVLKYMREYAIIVREEQIKYCAVGAAHYTAINVRSVPERLDDDLKEHMKVCRVDRF